MASELITGVIKDYAWGTPGGLDRVRGLPESGETQAEWWLGDHPQGEATIAETGQTLSAWLHDHGVDRVGFLLKVLTPKTPLSLQVHPTTAQAEEGFDREESQGIPVDGPTRVFRDRLAKPEVIVALDGPFDALAGMASDDEVKARLDALVAAGYPDEWATLWQGKIEEGRASCVGWLLGPSDAAASVVASLGPVAPADPLLELLWAHYPGDPGCAVALMMNRVVLEPGEALFVDAGMPHAYLSGVGVELMAPSDNVVRGGLTPKHIDVDTLLEIADFDPSPVPRLQPVRHTPQWREYAPAGQPFSLLRIDARDGSGDVLLAVDTPAICVNLDETAHLVVDGASDDLARGQAMVISSGKPADVVVTGGSAVWLAKRR